MKVICTFNNKLEKYLTLNIVYDVIYEETNIYFVKNDIGQKRRYKKCYFKTTSEYRNYKIDKLLE